MVSIRNRASTKVGPAVSLASLWALLACHVAVANQDYSYYACGTNTILPSRGKYFCQGINDNISSLDPALLGIFFCDESNLDAPNRNNCSSLCLLYSTEFQRSCEKCGLTDLGTLAYDCTNLFPNAECNEKDSQGNCGEEYIHWLCFSSGLGYQCTNYGSSGAQNNPAFPYDIVPESYLTLYCANDIGGKTAQDCEQPVCQISDENNFALCSSCQLLDDGTFAYDCAQQIPHMNCSILDEYGECQDASTIDNTTPTTPASLNSAGLSSDSNDGGDQDDEEWSHTFEDIDPTLFNVLSDSFAYVTRVLVGLAIAALCPIIMTLQLTIGRGAIPLGQLSVVPGDFLQAARQASLLQFSWPAILLVILLTLADFSHTIADVGLSFVTVTQTSAAMPVLDTSFEHRNPNRLMRTMGDPMYSRTAVFPKVLYSNVGDNFGDADNLNYDATRPLSAIADRFIDAVVLMAIGSSPFATNNVGLSRDVVMGNVSGFVGRYNEDGSPLSSLDKQIPLDCYGNDASTAMVSFEEIIPGTYLFDHPIESNASVPNCSFTGLRSSGIYGGSPGRAAAILETVAYVSINNPRLFTSAEGSDLEHPVFLYNGNSTFKSLELTPEDKKLARDRSDWKLGRQVSGVEGIMIGIGASNITIELGTVVVASGQQIAGIVSETDASSVEIDLSSAERRNQYALVGEIPGKCPSRPSGLPLDDDTQCVALIELSCESFPEDFAPALHPVYYPANTENSKCEVRSVNMAFGSGFLADAEVVTLVAGLYGLIEPNLYDITARTFLQNALLAALFATGTIQESPSTEEVVRPNVNMVYIIFMLLPAFLSLLLVVIALLVQRWCLPIPSSPWELMVLAKDSPDIPSRGNDNTYPAEDNTLVFAFFDAVQDDDDEDLEDEINKPHSGINKPRLGIVHVPPRSGCFGKQKPTTVEDEPIELKETTTRTTHGVGSGSDDSDEENNVPEESINASEKSLVKIVSMGQGSFPTNSDESEAEKAEETD